MKKVVYFSNAAIADAEWDKELRKFMMKEIKDTMKEAIRVAAPTQCVEITFETFVDDRRD